MHMLAALGLATGTIFYRIRKFLDRPRPCNHRWPEEKL